ncbi:MAG TPA: endonuclease/exonuclease/phosphatase family protein [Verrucomicrobiae bacterium]|nr:endonuclease/exonuclease/phosphatase family protein [Verrucomicrobiae bacterium]
MHPFRAMTFNVNGQARFGWERRASVCGKVMEESHPDIVGFQEFGVTNWETFSDHLPYFDIYYGLEAGDIFINPIAWDKNRYHCREAHTQWLSETPHVYSKGWDGSERGVSWVVLEDCSAERVILFLNVHLDNKGEKARIEGTRQMLTIIGQYPNSLPTIITGDFNCSPHLPHDTSSYTRKPYDMLVDAGFCDSWSDVNPETAQVPHTFHGYQGEEYVADQFGTWHTDWIMVRSIKTLQHEIIRKAEDVTFPSDHYPVVSLLEYTAESAA